MTKQTDGGPKTTGLRNARDPAIIPVVLCGGIPGELPLVLTEVQTGACLEEGDIVRYGDKYDRK